MGRPRNENQAAIQKELDVSKAEAKRLEKQGVDKGNLTELQKEKARKIKVEIATLEAKLAKFNREVIAHSEAKAYGLQIAQVVEQHWDEILINWPTEHAGQTELSLKQRYDKASIDFKNRLREAIENI
jgi:hypothetical protein